MPGLLAGTAAATAILTFIRDADFLANANFTRDFGGDVRWGNGAVDGDWEYSVVDADVPIGAGNPEQNAWVDGGSTNDHTVSFAYDGATTIALDPGLTADPTSWGPSPAPPRMS